MRERLACLLPILDSVICAVVCARQSAGRPDVRIDLDEAYDCLMHARRALLGARRAEETPLRVQRPGN